MHLVADGTGTLYLGYLAGALHGTLVDDSLDELHAGCLPLLRGMDAQHVHELNHVVVAVGRQEVDALAAGLGLPEEIGKRTHGYGLCYARLGCHVCHAVHRAEPDNVVDVDVVAHEVLAVVVNVDDAGKSFAMQPVEIQERAVLTETVDRASRCCP